MILEGKAKISAKKEEKISKKIPVFYNSAMKLNRDVSVFLVDSIPNKNLRIADPLAGSGVRSIRFLLELKKSKIKEAAVNDASKTAVKNVRKNVRLNRCGGRVKIFNQDANFFLLQNKPFDYVDIDPFGPPTPFLDSASRAISRDGILAVTATDTAALSGSAVKACLRKYWATPLRNHLMHEIGLRILIRRVQLSGTSHGKALTPVYSYSKLHYMRVFFKCSNKVSEIDKMMAQHDQIAYCNKCLSLVNPEIKCKRCRSPLQLAGKLWTGRLWDEKLSSEIAKKSGTDEFLKTISEESGINSFGFFDTHFLCRRLKISVPGLNPTILSLRKRGFRASRTHLRGNGIRTNARAEDVVSILKRMSKV